MSKNKTRSLNFWACVVLASVIFSLAMASTCVAKSSDLQSKFKDSEYKAQLTNLVTEINKINDDFKNGKISKEEADKTINSLIDDPQYNQVKIKKQIVDQEYEAAKKPNIAPDSSTFKTAKLDPDRTTSTASSTASSTSYWYTDLSNIQYGHDGWGIGASIGTGSFTPNNWAKAGARSELTGSYYGWASFNRYITAPRSGQAALRADIDWTGGCAYPDVCSIDFTLYKYVSGEWVKVNSGNIVSLTGMSLSSGPNNAHTSFIANLQKDARYLLNVYVNTKASSSGVGSLTTSSDFGLGAIGGTPIVHWQQFKLTY